MQEPGLAVNEAHRLSTLRSLNILDTPSEERFERLTRIAKQLFKVPIVAISLVDENRQWFKSVAGLEFNEAPRSTSFCGHTILQDNILVVSDTHLDHRFEDNPLVSAAPFVRFYAGRPISASNGQIIGSFCIIDSEPRYLEPSEIKMLNDIAELVEKEVNLPDLKRLNDRLLDSEQELLASLVQLRNKERHERSSNKCLEMISRGHPLHEVLNAIAAEVESANPETLACIELDHHLAGDMQRYWGNEGHQQVAIDSGHCWSVPVLSSNGKKLGRLTLVAKLSTGRAALQVQFLQESAILASIAVERDQSDRMIWKQANYDSLTGLPNRNLLRERVGQELSKARRHGLLAAMLFIDLDHFKQVNDTLGHAKGDQLLAKVAIRMRSCMRDSDTVARLGGDEFTVIAVELNHENDVIPVADKIIESLSREFQLGEERVYVTASVGIAFYPNHGDDMDSLIRSADRAMYEAKNNGRNRLSIFSE